MEIDELFFYKMNMSEKIEYMRKIQSGELESVDSFYDYIEYENYNRLQNEFLSKIDLISQDDFVHLLSLFDDDCFELSWQHKLSEIIAGNMIHFGEDRIKFYLSNLYVVPEYGRRYGWNYTIQVLLSDMGSLGMFENAVLSMSSEVKNVVCEILNDINIGAEVKSNLIVKLK